MALNPNSDAALEVSDQADFIMNAPIAQVASHLGMDIDEAVKMRVEAAVASAPPKMDITVRPIEPQGSLYGFASVSVGNIRIDDFKVVKNKDGELFVGMPSKPDKKSESGYRNTVFIDKDYKEDFNMAVIDKYLATVDRAHDRAAKPESIADQAAKAAKEADKHNAALPPKEKSTKARGDRGD
jgi:DNA-binding cell septation regulator SpoVG